MSKAGEETSSWEKLDAEFDHHLVDMKPFVLKLPHKSERQRCALWIKKLCDPAAVGASLAARKNRNVHSRLLLRMLRRGVLEGPFAHKPEPGGLKPLPTYMSIYFDEPLRGRSPDTGAADLPSWVSGELDGTDADWTPRAREGATPPTSSPYVPRRRHTYEDELPSPEGAPATPTRSCHAENHDSGRHKALAAASSSSDGDALLNSWNLGIEKPRYLRETPIPLSPIYLKSSLGRNNSIYEEQPSGRTHEKEAEMKVKVLEARHQEEKLKMQQKHDSAVQKILDRKNSEIEELKTMYRKKQKDSEETIRRLEKKAQGLVRESQVVRQSKEKQIDELKKMSEQSADSLRSDWEKKLHAAVAKTEQEKFELQKKHTESIQELLEDTNQRLAKMESEYAAQMQATEKMVKELETRVKQLSVEVEHGNTLRLKVSQEKTELEVQIASISSELQEANRRCVSLTREKEQLIEQHDQTLQKMQAKHDADMSHYQQEHMLSAAKASEVMKEMEHLVSQLRQQLQDSEHKRQKQLRDRESQFQQEKLDLQHASDKKVRLLQNELEADRTEAKKKMTRLEDALREKDEQLAQLWGRQKQQALQAEDALEQLRRQAELSAEKAYADTKQQMEKVEADLDRSKALREQQAKEFSKQLEELKQRYEEQIVELKLQHEQERTHLFQQHSTEKDSLVRDHQREIDNLERQSRAAMLQHQEQTQEWRERDSQNLATMEAQVQALREELRQAHTQRKQQLMELGLLREEERQRAARDQEAALGRLRAEMDRARLDLERTHAAERELAAEKIIADLQSSIAAVREEGRRLQQGAQHQLLEAESRWEAERRRLTGEADVTTKALNEKVENLQRQFHAAEKKLMNKELENQEQITRVRQECEMKIKGLMPASLRRELEDTIASLRSQVGFLQKRAAVLQEELDSYRSRR
ncbi:centrosomal protein of 112 kDa isoform X3 [Scleropages formosus]|uniref:Centrosomal protein 112 n=1 Tax=Scleropages formosus TaxID=113540 RepID=A0A8C9UY32_SCLFO|nr:centrosomal protein of 112 kDa isoform X3 [Scleropages formosus]